MYRRMFSPVDWLVRVLAEKWQSLCDWSWFNFSINRNEFHPKLDLDHHKILSGKTTLKAEQERIIQLRQRAHELDMKYND